MPSASGKAETSTTSKKSETKKYCALVQFSATNSLIINKKVRNNIFIKSVQTQL